MRLNFNRHYKLTDDQYRYGCCKKHSHTKAGIGGQATIYTSQERGQNQPREAMRHKCKCSAAVSQMYTNMTLMQ